MNFDKKTQAYIKSITNSRNLKSADLNAEPKYYLSHNKDCAEMRQRLMADADDFQRGYLFGTACICNGAEDRILDKIEVRITRYYTKGNLDVMTEQRGICLNADALPKLEKVYRNSAKVQAIKDTQFGEEVATEVTQNW